MFCKGRVVPSKQPRRHYFSGSAEKGLGCETVWVSGWKGLCAPLGPRGDSVKAPVPPCKASVSIIGSCRVLTPKRRSFLLFPREYECIWELWGCWWVTCLVDTWDQSSSRSSPPRRSWGWLHRGERSCGWQLEHKVGIVRVAIVKPCLPSMCDIIPVFGYPKVLSPDQTYFAVYERKMLRKLI